MLAQRPSNCGCHLRLDLRDRITARIADVERKALPSLTIVGGLPSRAPEPLDVERRGHCEESQVRAKRLCRIERQREREVIVEAALMHFVEQHRGDAHELRIGLDARQEHAVGHRDDEGALADLAVEPGCIADRLARLFVELRLP